MTYIIVLHYEKIPLTAACCETLVCQREPTRILVVDNGSPSHGESELRTALPPEVNILRLPTNRGFSGGMNAGMREVLKDPATDSVLFLNNDTRCPPELVGSMRAVLATDPMVGLVGCDMVGAGGGEGVCAGYKISVLGYPRRCRSGESPDFLQGSCLLLPRDVLEATGGFDEDYEFFYEDADLSFRVRRLGRTFAIVPEVKLFHYGTATLGTQKFYQLGCFGQRVFLEKWYSFPGARAFISLFCRLVCYSLLLHVRTIIQLVRGYHAGCRKARQIKRRAKS